MGQRDWEIGLGQLFVVPVDERGQPLGQPVRMKNGAVEAEEWGWGDYGGLEGGLLGGPNGALQQVGTPVWSMNLTFEGEIPDETMAMLWDLSLEEWLDLKRWWAQEVWLEKVLGNSWRLE